MLGRSRKKSKNGACLTPPNRYTIWTGDVEKPTGGDSTPSQQAIELESFTHRTGHQPLIPPRRMAQPNNSMSAASIM